jgi:hypothetical protein
MIQGNGARAHLRHLVPRAEEGIARLYAWLRAAGTANAELLAIAHQP